MATAERAKIEKVEHDVATGWYTIHVDHPDLKKVTTKMQQKAEEAAAFRQSGALVDIQYSAKDSTRINPHTNQPYKNVYYESAAESTPETASNGASGIDIVEQPGGPRESDSEKAWRIAKSTGAKLAVMTLPLMDVTQRDPETQQRIALWWAIWILSAPQPAGAGGGGFPANDEPQPDDDIPF